MLLNNRERYNYFANIVYLKKIINKLLVLFIIEVNINNLKYNMKYLLVITLIAAMMASAYGFYHHQHTFRNSDDVFEYVSTANHQIYILFLYDGNWARQEARNPYKLRLELEREELAMILAKYGKDVQYMEINVTSGDYSALLQEMGIKSSDLEHSPLSVAIEDGHGVWVQGPRENHRIAEILDNFDKNPESHWY